MKNRSRSFDGIPRLLLPGYAIFLFLAASCNLQLKTGTITAPSDIVDASGPGTPATSRPDSAGIRTPDSEADFTSTPTATIRHQIRPGEPGAPLYYVMDYSSKASSAYHAASGGDAYSWNLFERPFTPDEMIYLPELDILRTDMAQDGTWMYASIRLEGAPAGGGNPARYGVEIDTDMDGRGNTLVWAATPAVTAWTTDGVQILEDQDRDVGGSDPRRAEAGWDGNGYERLAFDEGRGENPDSAWARIAPGDPKQVQIAFLRSAIGQDAEFLWSAWADAGLRNPEWFDYNDRITPAEAGSPMQGAAEYPLKKIATLDNTCRTSFGFTLTGNEPRACPVFTPTATLTPTRTATATVVPAVFLVTSVNISFSRPNDAKASCPFDVGLRVNIITTAAGTVHFTVFRAKDPDPWGTWGTFGAAATGAGMITPLLNMSLTTSQTLHMQVQVTSPNVMWSNVDTFILGCA